MNEAPKLSPELRLFSEGPHDMKFVDHIGVIDNFMSQEFCDVTINSFEYYYGQRYVKENAYGGGDYKLNATGEGDTQFKHGQMGRKDNQLYLEVADAGLASQVNAVVGAGFEIYAKEYAGIIDSADPLSSWTCKIQRTDSGGGYHIWHCEDGSFIYRDRVLTWMIYLNDIPYENGGGTDFLHQKCSFQPTRGTIVFWPAAYTHMHRGSFLTGEQSKYIATGWFLREPGGVSERIIQEKQKNLIQ